MAARCPAPCRHSKARPPRLGDTRMTTDTRRTQGGLGRGLASLIPTTGDTPGPRDRDRTHPRQPVAAPRAGSTTSSCRRSPRASRCTACSSRSLLTEVDGGYQLIAGERRLRASVIAGRHTIPAVVRTADEQSQLSLALVENLQRTDLNALDEARAFRQLMDEFGLTQEQVAQRIGRSRAAVANTLRLLSVAPAVQDAVRDGTHHRGPRPGARGAR